MQTEVVTVEPQQKLRSVISLMAERDVSCIPVIDEGVLVGIFTNNDLLFLNILWVELPGIEIDEAHYATKELRKTIIKSSNSSVSEIIATMCAEDTNHILLVDNDTNFIGRVSKDRILRSVASTLLFNQSDIGFLSRKVIDRIVMDPIFHDSMPSSLKSYRELMIKRGTDTIFLHSEGNEEYTHYIDEEAIKDILWKEVVNS